MSALSDILLPRLCSVCILYQEGCGKQLPTMSVPQAESGSQESSAELCLFSNSEVSFPRKWRDAWRFTALAEFCLKLEVLLWLHLGQVFSTLMVNTSATL